MDAINDDDYLSVLDYSVFIILLAVSALVGAYFAFCAKQKQNSTSEYLLGGKTMGIFPIAMSLIASSVSGITLVGLPSEMYVYGTQLTMALFTEFAANVVVAFVYIPVFYKLDIASSYEYFTGRFGPAVRNLASGIFVIKIMVYISFAVYIPALVFSQVTGLSLEVLILVFSAVCIFYTTLGGIKAVVWTDTLQMLMMVIGVVTVAIKGTSEVGGVANIYEKNQQSQRLEFFNMSMDPTIRHTFWTVLVGSFFHQMSACTINQAMVQRCLAMPTLKKARITIAIFAFGNLGFFVVSSYIGLVVYTAFSDCDPVTVGTLIKADRVLPYFVMKISRQIPGLAGIFASGVFSASLSTMSTGLNSMCGVILEGFIRPFHKKPLPEKRAALYMKIITVVLGVISVLLACVADKLSGIIQAAFSISGIAAGSLFGLFTLGMLFPWANATGAFVGCVSAVLTVASLCIGSQLALHNKQLVFPKKPMSIAGCDNSTLIQYHVIQSKMNTSYSERASFWMFSISYKYYALIGMLVVLVVGMLVSYFTGFNDPNKMDPNMFSPVIKRYINIQIKRKINKKKNGEERTSTDQMDNLIQASTM